MTFTTIDHTKFIDRIYDILISDSGFKKTFGSNIIKGQPTNERTGNENTDMPWVNIIEADNPIVSKKVTARGNPPSYLMTLEYWIIIHAREESSVDTHNKLTQYAIEIETIMQRYPQLSLLENDLNVRLISTRPVTKLVAPLGSAVQARNVMVSVEAYYQPINTPKSIEYLTGERSHTTDPAEALAIINDGNDGSIAPDGSTRPFTSIPLPIQESAELIPINDTYFGFNEDLLIYVNPDADAEFDITVTGEYAGSPPVIETTFHASAVNGVIRVHSPDSWFAERFSIKPTRITGATSIDLAGVRIEQSNGVLALEQFSLVVAVTESEFPFDHDVNTSVGLAVGTYFFPQLGRKELERIIVSSQDTDPIPITISTSVDGMDYTQEGVIEALVNTPTTYNFNKVFQEFAFVKFVATKAFRLHELNVLGAVIE